VPILRSVNRQQIECFFLRIARVQCELVFPRIAWHGEDSIGRGNH
jgi:hypothetical protein